MVRAPAHWYPVLRRSLHKIIALGILLPVLLAGVVLLVSCTESGTRALLQMAQRVTPLEVHYDRGTLWSALQFERLLYSDAGLSLQIDNLVLEWSSGCLWRGELCFTTLAAEQLALTLPADDDPASAGPARRDTDARMMVIPIPIRVDSLEVAAVAIDWRDGAWQQGALHAGLRVFGSRVEVTGAVIDHPHLTLSASGTAQESTASPFVPPRIDLPLDLSIAQLTLTRPTWTIGASQGELQQLSLQGQWRNTQLQSLQLNAHSAAMGRLSLRADIAFAGDWPVQAEATVELAQAPPLLGSQGQRMEVSVEGALSALTAHLRTTGVAPLRASASIDLLDADMPFSLRAQMEAAEQLRLQDIGGFPEALLPLHFDSAADILVEGSRAEQRVRLQAQISGLGYQALPLSLSARHAAGRVDLEALSLGDDASASNLRITGQVDVAEPIAWQLSLQSSGFDIPQLHARVAGRLQGSLQMSGNIREEAWQVALRDIAVTGSVNGLPASISGYAGVNHALELAPGRLDADVNGARLALTSAGGSSATSQLHLLVDELGLWLPGSDGSLDLTAQLGGNRVVTLHAGLQQLRREGVMVAQGTLTGSYPLDDPDAPLELDARLDRLRVGDVAIDSLALAASGTPSRHALGLVAQGDLRGELALTGSWRDGVWEGALAPTTVQLPWGEWQLSEPVALTGLQSAQQLVVADHCWRQQRAVVCVRDSVLGSSGTTTLDITGDVALLAPLFPADTALQGELTMAVQSSWTPENGVQAAGRAESTSLLFTRRYSYGETASLAWDRFDAVFDYAAAGFELGVNVHRQGRSVLQLDAHFAPERAGPVAGAVTFERLQLLALAPFFPLLSRLEGEVSGRAELGGTVDQLTLHGELSLEKALAVLVGNPTELAIDELTLDLQGSSAAVRGSASLGGGPVAIEGRLGMRPELFMDVTFVGTNHAVLYPPATQLLISEDLRIVATETALDIRGDVTVVDGELKFEQLPEGGVALSGDVVQVDPTGKVVRETLPFDVSMDVRVGMPGGFRVSGSTLESRLAGELHLVQKAGGYLQVFGDLNVSGGELYAYKQRLQVKRGVISFSGEPDNPGIDVRAQRDINSNVAAGIQITGYLQDELILEIYSEPAMSQREALSYLIRGRGLDDGAGADGAALALSLAGGVLNRTALVSELNKIPGISSVEFGAEGAEDEVVGTVSGYVGEKIYLSYGIGLYEPINVLTARFYVLPSLWFEIVSRLENSIDLYYSFDIE